VISGWAREASGRTPPGTVRDLVALVVVPMVLRRRVVVAVVMRRPVVVRGFGRVGDRLHLGRRHACGEGEGREGRDRQGRHLHRSLSMRGPRSGPFSDTQKLTAFFGPFKTNLAD